MRRDSSYWLRQAVAIGVALAALTAIAGCDALADREELQRDRDSDDKFNEQVNDRIESFDLGG